MQHRFELTNAGHAFLNLQLLYYYRGQNGKNRNAVCQDIQLKLLFILEIVVV